MTATVLPDATTRLPGAARATCSTHASAQSHLRANPTDPLLIDANRNGIAYEGADGDGFVNPPVGSRARTATIAVTTQGAQEVLINEVLAVVLQAVALMADIGTVTPNSWHLYSGQFQSKLDRLVRRRLQDDVHRARGFLGTKGSGNDLNQ